MKKKAELSGNPSNHFSMKSRTLIVLDCVIMTHHAVIMLMLGPLVPEIMKAFAIRESAAGLILGAGSLGFMLGPLAAGIGLDRMGIRKIILTGYFSEVLFLVLFGLSPWFWSAVLLNFLLISASGFLEISANVIPTHVKTGNSVAVMNLVHFFFSAGAFGAPLAIGWFLSGGGAWQNVILFLAVPTLILGIVFTLIKFEPDPQGRTDPGATGREHRKGQSIRSLLGNPAVFFGALALFFFMGAELGFSSWLVHFLEKNREFTKIQASLGLSLFWIGIMAGRLGNSFLSGRFSSFLLVGLSSVLGLVCGLPFLLFRSAPVIYILLTLIGLAMAGGYPLVLGELNRRFPGSTGAVTGILTFGAGTGAMVFQWLIGVTAEHGSLTLAMAIPPVLLMLMALSFRLTSERGTGEGQTG